MFVSVLVPRLRGGKSVDDFVEAWYPQKGFGVPVRGPILARNVANDREILALSFIDLPSRERLQAELARVSVQEAERHERISEVLQSTYLRGIYEVTAECDFSSDETVERGRPNS